MNIFFPGLKTTLSSSVLFVSVIFIVFYSQHIWLTWQPVFSVFLQAVTAIVVLFSAQFNQSRFSLIALLLLALLTANQLSLTVLVTWQGNGEWQLLASVFSFVYLAWSKDRGLLSVHTFYRMIIFISCIFIAYAWLALIDWLSVTYLQLTLLIQHQHWFSLYIPVGVSLLLILFASVRKKHLFQPAILVTAVLTCCYFFDVLTISWLATLILLNLYFLISVITSSYFLAYRDELTGLPSRRALYQMALSLTSKYSVAMMDIDHFKKFNDTYGHDIGDQVLKLVAAKLSKVKGGGRVFRYGGEEFTVIFPRKLAEQTIADLEKVRAAVASYKMVIRHPIRKGKKSRTGKNINNTKTVSVTISIGVATRQAKQSFDQTMKSADEKLYQAKKHGRNNVCS